MLETLVSKSQLLTFRILPAVVKHPSLKLGYIHLQLVLKLKAVLMNIIHARVRSSLTTDHTSV